jgi:hypothetical protein
VEVDQAKDSNTKSVGGGTSVTDLLRHVQVSKKASVEVTKRVDDYKERNVIIIPIISHCKLLSLAKKCERGVFCYWEMNKRDFVPADETRGESEPRCNFDGTELRKGRNSRHGGACGVSEIRAERLAN